MLPYSVIFKTHTEVRPIFTFPVQTTLVFVLLVLLLHVVCHTVDKVKDCYTWQSQEQYCVAISLSHSPPLSLSLSLSPSPCRCHRTWVPHFTEEGIVIIVLVHSRSAGFSLTLHKQYGWNHGRHWIWLLQGHHLHLHVYWILAILLQQEDLFLCHAFCDGWNQTWQGWPGYDVVVIFLLLLLLLLKVT